MAQADDTAPARSLHIGVHIARPWRAVYEFAAAPANLAAWASGLGSTFEIVGGRLIADSPMGRIAVTFTPRNELGVLDHDVTLPSGEIVHNPMRVMPDGDGCEVLFTVRRQPGMTDEQFARDAETVRRDLETLKRLLD